MSTFKKYMSIIQEGEQEKKGYYWNFITKAVKTTDDNTFENTLKKAINDIKGTKASEYETNEYENLKNYVFSSLRKINFNKEDSINNTNKIINTKLEEIKEKIKTYEETKRKYEAEQKAGGTITVSLGNAFLAENLKQLLLKFAEYLKSKIK